MMEKKIEPILQVPDGTVYIICLNDDGSEKEHSGFFYPESSYKRIYADTKKFRAFDQAGIHRRYDAKLLSIFTKEIEKYNYERGLGGDSNIQPEQIQAFLDNRYSVE